jgi:transposase InsO family protein
LGSSAGAQWNSPAIAVNDVWAYDFIERKTASGATFRVFNVIDEVTRRGMGSLVAPAIGASQVQRDLERLFARHGKPARVRCDNGREFIAEPLMGFLEARRIAPVFIDAGCPWQNPICERFNGSMADELLDVESFHSATEARVLVDRWVKE